MSFQAKKINKKPIKSVKKDKSTKKKNISVNQKNLFKIKLPKLSIKVYILLACIVLFAIGSFAAYQHKPTKVLITKQVLKTIGSTLPEDKDRYTNILLLGVGGEGHDGSGLTDTLLVASINQSSGKVFMSSIPRDLYVKHKNIISQRINSVYDNARYRLGEEKGVQTLSEIIGEFMGFPIHYYIKVNFQSLIDVVDALEGIEIYNETTIYDPYYPGPNYTYQTFSLQQGLHTINGETALKFVRSRKTSSDFARSNRQQQVLVAIKDKALQLDVLTSPEKLRNIYDSIEKNIKTNLTLREITTLAGVASGINRTDISSVVVHDDFTTKGGFLYTPPRSLYNDAFVLLPADPSLSQIHTFVKLHRLHPEVMASAITIDVLNGTKTSGLASKTASILIRFGFSINQVANKENRDETLSTSYIQTGAGKDASLVKALQLLFPPITTIKPVDPTIPDPTQDGLPSSIKLVAGEDLVETLKFYDVYSSLIPLIQQAIQENRQKNQANDNEDSDISDLDIDHLEILEDKITSDTNSDPEEDNTNNLDNQESDSPEEPITVPLNQYDSFFN